MSITPTKAFVSLDSDRYRALLMEFPPRSITSTYDLEATQAVIDRLLDCPKLTTEETDYVTYPSFPPTRLSPNGRERASGISATQFIG
jgi:hypothetical protein